MKHLALFALTAFALAAGLVPPSHAVEILRWERMPLAVPLLVGQERVIFVDRNVRVGVPATLGDRLRVQSAGGAIYLRANEAIEPTRLQLQDADTGALILLDIAATPAREGQTALEPVRILEAQAPDKHYGVSSDALDAADLAFADGPPRKPRETPVAVVLTRYAAQNLYAPLRTVESVSGIGRVNLRRGLVLDTLLPTLPIQPKALAAWRLEDQWVTAVRLTNASTRWLDLDPRALQGDFVAATFQHPSLGPAGHSSDTTMLYLVTRGHGLAESLLPSLSPVDATLNLPAAAAVGHVAGGRDEK